MTTIAISDFVRRQTHESEFSHWTISDEELLERVQDGFDQAQPGYRDGVCLVRVAPEGFYSAVVVLQEGDRLEGTYRARKAGEDPRKSTRAVGKDKSPAALVDVVLYRHDVLEEGNEASCEADWEIISVNANFMEDEMPINVGALLANHFELSGGTATGYTDSEFVAQLRESVLFWSDKAFAGGKSES